MNQYLQSTSAHRFFFFSSRRRHTRFKCDWSSDVCSSDLTSSAELIKAGLKAGPDSDDVVLASSGQTQLIHVKDRDRARIHQIADFLKAQEWTGVLFTAGTPLLYPSPQREGIEGSEPGTFSTRLIHLDHAERGPDIVLTFPWSSAKNAFGVPGADFTDTRGATGPLKGNAGNHGSM